LTGLVDANSNGVYDPSIDTTSVFTINLNLDNSLATANDTYTIAMFGSVDGQSSLSFTTNSGFTFNGGNDPWADFIDSSASRNDLLLTPEVNGLRAGSIQSNANTGGVNSGDSVGSGESMRLDFVNNLTGNPQKTGGSNDYSVPANEDHSFTHHYLVNGTSATFSSTSDAKVQLVASTDADGNNIVGDGALDAITSIVIAYNGSSQLISLAGWAPDVGHDFIIGGHLYTVNTHLVGGVTEVQIDHVTGANLASGGPTTEIFAFTAGGYNSLEITSISGDTFKVGGFGATATSIGQPVDFSVPLTITDGDGDTASGALNIDLLPAGTTTQNFSSSLSEVTAGSTAAGPDILGSSHNDTLNGDGNANILAGGAGNDTLTGNGGADTLIGGAGDDTLTGGAGNDLFVLQVTNGGHDNITDFVSGGDEILVDIGGGLTIGAATSLTISNFATGTDENSASAWNESASANKFFFNTSTHELFFSANGTGSDKIDLAHVSSGVPAATDVHTF
jgi:Ca2+-binding RTX toxin-like protein